MTQVWKRLFIGTTEDAGGLGSANPHGISTVVILSRKKVKKSARGVNYLEFPLKSSGPLPVGTFDQIIDAIAENIRWGSVLVQSSAGRNRAPVIAAAWMHAVGAKDISAALEDIHKLCPIAPSSKLLLRVKKLLE